MKLFKCGNANNSMGEICKPYQLYYPWPKKYTNANCNTQCYNSYLAALLPLGKLSRPDVKTSALHKEGVVGSSPSRVAYWLVFFVIVFFVVNKLTYNSSWQCRGLGIRYPAWRSLIIFLALIAGYGRAPANNNIIIRCRHWVRSLVKHSSGFKAFYWGMGEFQNRTCTTLQSDDVHGL